VLRMLTAVAALIGIVLFRAGRVALSVAYLWMDVGPVWAVAAVAALLLLRFSVPIRAGVFLGAINLLHWPWIAALILAAPRLFTILPGLLASQIARWRHPRPLWPSPAEANLPADAQM
jgi:hypothetical protein